MIDAYVDTLFSNRLLLPLWGAIALWAALFAVNHAIYRWAEALRAAQSLVIAPAAAPARAGRNVVLQGFFALVVFGAGFVLGEPAYAFFAGGLLITMAFTIGFNIHGALFARSLGLPGGGEGVVKLSPSAVLRIRVAQLTGAGFASLCMLAVVPHCALAGACLFLWSSAYGMHRRADRLANAAMS